MSGGEGSRPGSGRAAWRVVWTAMLLQLVILGSTVYSFGVLVKPLAAAFGASRAEVAISFTAFALVGGLLGPFVGALMSRHPLRRLMLVGVGLIVAGFALLSLATSLRQVYLCFGVLVGSGNVLTLLPATTLIVRWFDERPGLPLGMSLFAASAGAPLFVSLATFMTVRFDWRWTVAAFAGLSAALLPAAILAWVREPPRAAPRGAEPLAPRRLLSLLKDPRLLVLTGVLGLGATPSLAVIQTVPSYITDLGQRPAMAASLVSVMTVVAAASKLLFGRLADMFGARVTTYLALSLQALAVLVLAAGREPLALTVGAVLQGLGYGGLAPLISVLVASVFGRERFAEVIGAVSLLMLPFSLASLPLASLVQDQTGSYAPAYLLFAGLYVLAGTCLALLPFAPLGTARTSGQVARSSA